MFSPARHKPVLTSLGRPDDLLILRSELLRAAAERQTQLLNLRPIKADDLVATEYHASVRRIFDDIHSALDRMDAGTYGECTRCSAEIPLERLVDRPWTLRCEPCASRLP